MNTLEIQKVDITKLAVDAIVNAANSGLQAGGGVCGAIFHAAGAKQLQASCDSIGHCNTGSAVITPGFFLKAKYVIHAVGPIWQDGNHHEPQLLYSAYRSSLELALKYNCHSIAFPLISSGIYGYPKDKAWRKAIQACKDFFEVYPAANLRVVFAVLNDSILDMGKKTIMEICPQFAKVEECDHKMLKVGSKQVDAVFFHLPTEPNGYLSNWYPASFVVDGVSFTSMEQYIMYRKCLAFGDQTCASTILATNDPQEQQNLGRKAKGYVDYVWAGMRQIIAIQGLLAKFSQNEDLKKKLLDTEDAWLVECAYSDTTWACGIRLTDEARFDTANWRGQNLLGFALMEVRRILREHQGLTKSLESR